VGDRLPTRRHVLHVIRSPSAVKHSGWDAAAGMITTLEIALLSDAVGEGCTPGCAGIPADTSGATTQRPEPDGQRHEQRRSLHGVFQSARVAPSLGTKFNEFGPQGPSHGEWAGVNRRPCQALRNRSPSP
jgi:hypothetical protein